MINSHKVISQSKKDQLLCNSSPFPHPSRPQSYGEISRRCVKRDPLSLKCEWKTWQIRRWLIYETACNNLQTNIAMVDRSTLSKSTAFHVFLLHFWPQYNSYCTVDMNHFKRLCTSLLLSIDMKMARALATVTRHSRRFKVTLVEILTLGMGAVTRFSSSNRDMTVNSPISSPENLDCFYQGASF